MGYTHYWDRKRVSAKKKRDAFCKDVKRLIAASGGVVAFEHDQVFDPPIVHPCLVRFNGKGEEGHETFYFDMLTKRKDSPPCEWFCKTARKPYDLVVCAVLIAAKHHFGSNIEVYSDGDWEVADEWGQAALFYENVLGRKAECPWPQKQCVVCERSYSVDDYAWGGHEVCAKCGCGSTFNGKCADCGHGQRRRLVSDNSCYWCSEKAIKEMRAANAS